MIKDLTTLKWKKYIYYTSGKTIFDIEQRKKKFDIDSCSTYIIDIENAPEKIQKAGDGIPCDISKYPELFVGKVPSIEVKFITEGGRELKREFPLQWLIEEGDEFIEGVVYQKHPNVYNGSYINKFNQEIFEFIYQLMKNRQLFSSKNKQYIISSLPEWLTIQDEKWMTEDYIDKYFLRGSRYNQSLAIKPGKDLYKFVSIKINGEDVNIWTDEVIDSCIKAIDAEKLANLYNKEIKLNKKSMENIASSIKEVKNGNGDNIKTFLNIIEGIVKFESLCVSDDVDTYYEYLQKRDELLKSYYTLIKDQDSWNNAKGTLDKYYTWSDQVNAPYKEDLWNVGEGRAANINDARKDPETGDFVLDENGNYIYDGCERCWLGAVNAPGAKYPWIVVNITSEIPSIIKFKYTYLDGTVKEVKPWGDKIFGGPSDEPRKEWGVASVAAEFEDNDFLISENRKDGGQSTFDINRFELVLEEE